MNEIKAIVVCLVGSCLLSCGVRGRPQPPLTPPEIGRGQPTFRRATEQFKFQSVPPVGADVSDPDEADADEESQTK